MQSQQSTCPPPKPEPEAEAEPEPEQTQVAEWEDLHKWAMDGRRDNFKDRMGILFNSS